MKEKKLTDEEIVKALECCTVDEVTDCENCPLIKESCAIIRKYALDLIHRLQSENEQLTEENKKLDKLLSEKRLDELKVAREIIAQNCILNEENAELKKQVDELKANNEHLDSENTRLVCEMDKLLDDGWDIMDEEADGWYKKGSKDTAKEIFETLFNECWAIKDEIGNKMFIESKIKHIAKQRYGVEVE